MGIRLQRQAEVQGLRFRVQTQHGTQPDKFFVGVIGTRNQQLIQQVIGAYTQENDNLQDQLLSILYWFRGSITRDDVWQLTPYEREKYIEFLNKRFKDAGDMMKKQIPVFV